MYLLKVLWFFWLHDELECSFTNLVIEEQNECIINKYKF